MFYDRKFMRILANPLHAIELLERREFPRVEAWQIVQTEQLAPFRAMLARVREEARMRK